MRVDPTVENGTISADIPFLGPFPASARPELNIDAIFCTQTKKHTICEAPRKCSAKIQRLIFPCGCKLYRGEIARYQVRGWGWSPYPCHIEREFGRLTHSFRYAEMPENVHIKD